MTDYWLQSKPALLSAFRSIKQTASSTISNRRSAVSLPEVPQLVVYPTYSYLEETSEFPYSVTIRGWLYSEGDANKRRNKLLLATTERFIGGQSPTSTAKFEQQLVDLDNEPQPDDLPDTSVYEDSTNAMLKQRMAPFFRKSMNLAAVDVEMLGKNGELETFVVDTDTGGRFEHTFHLSFCPYKVTAGFGSAECSINPIFMPPNGTSVISDIDDTVRLTGILSGKRDTLRNVLATPYEKVRLEGVSDWYRRMQARGATFHYVSNSPWQMYDGVFEFLRGANFPLGSMHLKRYQGVIDGIFEPVANRKVKTLTRIFHDFPHRKFILVGDGGELDLETYVQVARWFPKQVLAIYIRDLIIPKEESLEIEDPWEEKLPSSTASTTDEPADLIDLGAPLSPQRPGKPSKSTKPGRLNARKFDPAQVRAEPSRAEEHKASPGSEARFNRQKAKAEMNQATLGGVAGALFGTSSRPGAVMEAAHMLHDQIRAKPPPPDFVTSSQDYGDYERLDKERKRVDSWKARIIESKRSLPPGVELKLWKTPNDVESRSLSNISGGKFDLL